MNDRCNELLPICPPAWNTCVGTQKTVTKKNNQVLFLWKIYWNRCNTI